MTRALFAITTAMALSGCWWEGPVFYTGDPAKAAPVEPGLYEADLLGDHKPAMRIRIEWLADGKVRSAPEKPEKNGDAADAIFTPLTMPGRNIWVIQSEADGKSSSKARATYGLVERNGDMLTALPMIGCEGNEVLVRAAGGIVTGEQITDENGVISKPTGGSTCEFVDRLSLEIALRRYVVVHPKWGQRIRLKRIAD